MGVLGRSEKLKKWLEKGGSPQGWVIGVPEPLNALGEIAKVIRGLSTAIHIAVTGSSGKTTTKEMIAFILAEFCTVHKNPGNYNNALGVPLSLFGLRMNHEVSVLELGMSKRGEIGYLSRLVSPNIGVITNIQPAHLEGLGNLLQVKEAKAELLEGMNPQRGVLITSADDPLAMEVADRFQGKKLFVSMENRSVDLYLKHRPFWDGKLMRAPLEYRDGQEGELILAFPGEHLIYDAMLALATALNLGLPLKEGVERLREFDLPPMRFAIRRLQNGGFIVFDAYNANPASMEAAIRAFLDLTKEHNKKVLILGDMLELGPKAKTYHSQLGRFVASLRLKTYAIGDLAPWVLQGAKELDPSSKVYAFPKGALEDLFSALTAELTQGVALLIKGSRANKLEDLMGRIESLQGSEG
jgi:UDP-N-acetylmuramoyl-tripeptide--D-alanyl-D-alanine ligase